VLAGTVFAFNDGELEMGRGHIGLHDELPPGGADADHLERGSGFDLDKREAGGRWLGLEMSGARHDSQRCLASVAEMFRVTQVSSTKWGKT